MFRDGLNAAQYGAGVEVFPPFGCFQHEDSGDGDFAVH